MIDRLEILRGQRAKLHTVDTGSVTGTLGEITYTLEGYPITVEIRGPEDDDAPFLVLPWTSIVAIGPLEPLDKPTEPDAEVFDELDDPEGAHGHGQDR